jgi:hypothetical protein
MVGFTKLLQRAKLIHCIYSRTAAGNDSQAVSAVLAEVQQLKAAFLRAGADKAIATAKSVFAGEFEQLEKTHHAVIELLRRRLEELADFLQESILWIFLFGQMISNTNISSEKIQQ